MGCFSEGFDLPDSRDSAIRFLVEKALESVASQRRIVAPRTREEWIVRLCQEVMSESETSHHAVISSLVSSGVTTQEILHTYVPAVARRLGEMWVLDKASFVQVTVGAARLQALFQDHDNAGGAKMLDRTVPLGQSVLMILPNSEDHTLGAFVAADQFRRHGLWVRMAIRLTHDEIVAVVKERQFSMLGMSVATVKSVEETAELIDFLRLSLDHCPPIVVGGKYASDGNDLDVRTGADFAVRTAREAIERCGLASVTGSLLMDS